MALRGSTEHGGRGRGLQPGDARASGGWIVAFCAFLFGYTTLIGWAYYGEQFLEYVLGPRVVTPYRWIYCLLIVLGAIGEGRRWCGPGAT